MANQVWEPVTTHRCDLGECPVWDDKERRICWIDILSGTIHYFYPHSREYCSCATSQLLGSIALKKSGGLIAAGRTAFLSVNLNSCNYSVVVDVITHLADNRFNDGKCDPAGRFWAGSMSMSGKKAAGCLYALETDNTVTPKISGLTCSNGMAWSNDLTTFYHIDTPTRQVTAYAYDVDTGNIGDGAVVITIPAKDGYPDGMTIDSEGMLWIALWDGWKLVRYNPNTGEQMDEINLPFARVTSCTFGGDNLDQIYVTSATIGLTEEQLLAQPLAGSLLVLKDTGFRGLPAFAFNA